MKTDKGYILLRSVPSTPSAPILSHLQYFNYFYTKIDQQS
ncbi:hypothetical protein NC99_45360 [Sunxiuqinia dokdonensis]|uniref:Uncharacterized protein n=1 Tax=Sunxiuqinia dokdonensis TaxID=1409788 RepID=A0A0L8V2R4_9BACT|nr:hypothetical protein NC99_45360 [Sunxiuqinia dokdonensis]